MKDPTYWRRYVLDAKVAEIEGKLRRTSFVSGGVTFELVHFEKGKSAPSILISPGSAGHALVFAELAYRMHEPGYNVFIMPQHGGRTIAELIRRHEDALRHIAGACNDNIGLFGEGLGGYVSFYAALAGAAVKSLVCQNSPAVLTEAAYHAAVLQDRSAGRSRRMLLALARVLVKALPGLPLSISAYLDFRQLVDSKEENRRIEEPMVNAYLRDPDFDRRYPLSAVLSLLSTPPPKPLTELAVPTMFVVPVRGVTPSYIKDLFARLPPIKKRLIEVDDGVFWMVSHPRDAARVICDWFDETLGQSLRSAQARCSAEGACRIV